MNQPTKFTTKRVSPARNSVSHSLPYRNFSEGGSLLISHYSLLTVLLLALSPAPKAFGVSPAPDGGYSGGNTAEGTNALFSLTSGVWNTALGYQTLYHVTTGNQNTATGFQALFSNATGSLSVANGSQALYNNTTGSFNTATGFRTLYSNVQGSNNTANGYEALAFNNGDDNTAIGYQALHKNTTPFLNTAIGYKALYNNTTGSQNTATGAGALQNNTGNDNTANGSNSLAFNTTGSANTAIGLNSLAFNTTGSGNTANGVGALYNNLTGSNNTGSGDAALSSNINGSDNTANGVGALASNTSGSDNTAIGDNALGSNFSGSSNIALGASAGSIITEFNNIDIGNAGVGLDSGIIRIGTAGTQTATFIAGIRGVTTGNMDAIGVVIDSAGQLGTISSSRRFKKEIKPMDQTSEAILALKPVTFHYKSDTKGTAQFGLIAEEVAEVDPDLVVRDAEGEIYTVRYEAVNAMLLNEFLKEHRKVQELKCAIVRQEATIAQQQGEIKVLALLKSTGAKQEAAIAALTASLKAQASQIQNVSAQLEMSKPAPQLAGND